MYGFNDIATSEEKIITSPNWPRDYNNFDNCSWLIATDDGSRIEIILHQFSFETNFDFLVRYITILFFYANILLCKRWYIAFHEVWRNVKNIQKNIKIQ